MKKTIIAFFALLALAAASTGLEWLDAIDDADIETERAENVCCRDIYSKDDCGKFVDKGKCDKAKAKRYCALSCGHCSPDVCEDIQSTEICQGRKDEGRCGGKGDATGVETPILCPLTCGCCTPDDRDADDTEAERAGEFCYNLYSKDQCTTQFVEKGRCNKAKAMRYCADACGHCQDDVCKDIKSTEICEARKAEDRCGYEQRSLLVPLNLYKNLMFLTFLCID